MLIQNYLHYNHVSTTFISGLGKLPLLCNSVCLLFCIVVVVYPIELLKKNLNPASTGYYHNKIEWYRACVCMVIKKTLTILNIVPYS